MKTSRFGKTEWLQLAVLLLPAIVLAAVWQRLPESVPMHWDFRGEVDRWGPRSTLLVLPIISFGVWLLLLATPWLDPSIRRDPERHERTLRFLRVTGTAEVLLLALFSLLVISAALGARFDIARIILSAVLVLLVIAGNFLPSVRTNYFIGIRTPWTLDNPKTWQATHRLGGRILFFGALLLLALQFVLPLSVLIIAFTLYVFAFALWCCVYSFSHSRRNQQAA